MARKPNVSLTVSVTEGSGEESTKSRDVTFGDSGGISNLYNLRDFSYNECDGDALESRSTTSQNSPCDSDDSTPPLTPTRAERRPLKVDFVDRDVIMEMEGGRAQKRKDIEKDLKKLSRRGTGSLRYTEPRMSLLGKPLTYRMHRKDARIRKLQARIYNFLERPKIWSSVIYHLLMLLVVVSCLVLSVLATIDELQKELMEKIVLHLEPFLLIWLMAEYATRVWAAGCRSRYQGFSGRLRFMRRPLCIIDMVIIVACIIVLCLGSASPAFAASPLRGLRFFQILRMARMDRRGGSWKLLGSVVWAHRQELVTTLYIGFLGLLFSSFLVYLAEKDAHKKKFRNYADAIWWGVITLCTVGYGDVVPTTWVGKLIAAFSAVLGISFFALPAGILGSGFALKVQQQQRQKHLIRRRVPAATLIQCLWRCYAADENSMSIATWKPHMIPCPSPPTDRQWKNNTPSFVSRFSTRRRERSSGGSSITSNSSHSPIAPRKEPRKPNGTDTEEFPDAINRTSFMSLCFRSHLSLATGLADHQRVDQLPMKKENSSPSFSFKDQYEGDSPSSEMPKTESSLFSFMSPKKRMRHMSGNSVKMEITQYLAEPYDQDHSPKVTQLTETHKRAIRAIRKIKYFVSRKKFKEALRPYDVKDVIEQYSAGHVDMLSRIKSLQSRLDQILGKVGSKKKDVYDSKQSLASRVVKVERSVEDIESKLDLLIDLYKEDRKILLQYCHNSQGGGTPTTQGEVTSCLKSSSSSLKAPRSILSDKQFSEPSTPTLRSPAPHSMQRNLSDLSQRIKKRVTYRLMSLNVDDSERKIDTKNIPFKGRRKSASFDTGDELIMHGHSSNVHQSKGYKNDDDTEQYEEVFPDKHLVGIITENSFDSSTGQSQQTSDGRQPCMKSMPLSRSQRRERFIRDRLSRDSSNKSNTDDFDILESGSLSHGPNVGHAQDSLSNSPNHVCYSSDSGVHCTTSRHPHD